MKCPECERDMSRGSLLGDRYAIKWMNEGESLFLGIFAMNAVKIGSGGGLARPSAKGFRCENCGIIIIIERNA